MAKNWNNGSNSDDNLSNLKIESLSLGQRLLSKCLKKTGISVSVRGIAVNTTSQIKTAGSAWKSDTKYYSTSETKTGTLDDVSFPDLLGSSNRDVSVNQTSERSSVSNENDRVSMDSRRERYRNRNRYNSIQSTQSQGINSSRDGTLTNSSSFKNINNEEQDDILGSDFLMPGMKGNYPLGFTNFIGKGVQSPPPPPPSVPYPTTDRNIYQSYQKYTITRLKSTSSIQSNTGRPQYVKTSIKGSESPPISDSNWNDNKSDGYNEAELTTAIDSLNNSIQADRSGEELTIKPFVTEKESEQYMDLNNFEDNNLLLDNRLSNQLDDRIVNQLEDRLSNQLENTLSNQIENVIQETLTTNQPTVIEKRKKSRYVRRKKHTNNNNNNNTNTLITSSSSENITVTVVKDNNNNVTTSNNTNNNSNNMSKKEKNESNSEYTIKTTKEDVGNVETNVCNVVHTVDETSTSSSLNSHNTEQSTIEVQQHSETEPTDSKQEKSTPRSRRPRYRNRSKKKIIEDNSKINEEGSKIKNTNENEPIENAVNEKTHEKKIFKRYRRKNSQQNTSANSSNNNNNN